MAKKMDQPDKLANKLVKEYKTKDTLFGEQEFLRSFKSACYKPSWRVNLATTLVMKSITLLYH